MAPNVQYSYSVETNVLDLGLLDELNDRLHGVFTPDDDALDKAYVSPFVPTDAYDRVVGVTQSLGLSLSWRTEELEPDGDIAVKRIHVEIYEVEDEGGDDV